MGVWKWGVLAPVVWAVCPLISCISLNSDVCAYKNAAGSLFLTTQKCSAGLSCSAASIYPYWWPNAPIGSQLYCETVTPLPSAVNTTYVPVPCLPFQSGKELVRGPDSECSLDSDCRMLDGTYISGGCRCGFRASGLGLCHPHPSSSVFEGYWTDCESGNGFLVTREAYEYWSFYMTYYVYLLSDISCASLMRENSQLLEVQLAFELTELANAISTSLLLIFAYS